MNRFNRYIVPCLMLFCLPLQEIAAVESRHLLTDTYTRKFLSGALIPRQGWLHYPSYAERTAWERIPDRLRETAIGNGEKYLGYKWPSILPTMYLEFTRSGNREVVDKLLAQRMEALRCLSLAELTEGRGRFIDDIINGVFSFCEQTYWGMSATFYMYRTGSQGHDKPNTVLPDKNDRIVDLYSGDAAADLAWIWYFFREEFDKISAVITRRLKDELYAKILLPFYERNDFWWITGWGEGRVNNWTPWCSYNMLVCILLLEEDPQKIEDGIYKTMASVDLFINSYPEDGGCSEGPGYWAVAGGKMFDYLDLLKKATDNRINVFQDEFIRNIGRYIYRAYIGKGDYFTNFADSQFKLVHDGGRIYRYGKCIEDTVMQQFGALLLHRQGEKSFLKGRIGEVLENLFGLEGLDITEKAEPLLKEHYFPDLDVAIARDKPGSNEGFYFAAKGGHNSEQHNHNDVGSFILFYNGNPVMIDVGVGTYTRETFGKGRYNIWTMQSNYHNLPVVNGVGQQNGSNFKAVNSKFNASPGKVSFSTDISKAYPAEAKVESWVRSYTLERGKRFLINDNYRLTGNKGGSTINFMTTLPCSILKPGIAQLEGDGFVLHLKYNPELMKASIENIEVTDSKLQAGIGDKVSRMVFEMNGSKLDGNTGFEVIAVK